MTREAGYINLRRGGGGDGGRCVAGQRMAAGEWGRRRRWNRSGEEKTKEKNGSRCGWNFSLIVVTWVTSTFSGCTFSGMNVVGEFISSRKSGGF